MWEGVLDDDGILWASHVIRAEQPGERGRAAYVGYDSAGTPVDTIPHPRGEVDPWATTLASGPCHAAPRAAAPGLYSVPFAAPVRG